MAVGANPKPRGLLTTLSHSHTVQKPAIVNINGKEVSFICWNIECLLDKLSDDCFVDFLNKFDVICLLETFMIYKFDHVLKFPDFECIQKCACKLSKHGRGSGGVTP